jgi:Tol biopolymer transport system component
LTRVVVKIGVALVVAWAALVMGMRVVGAQLTESLIIAYTANDITTSRRDVMLLDESYLHKVNLTERFDSSGHPTWSYDGSQLTFSARREGTALLYSLNMDTAEIFPLRYGDIRAFSPAWSPTDDRLAYLENHVSSTFLIVFDGATSTTRTIYETEDDINGFQWTTSGKWIVVNTVVEAFYPETLILDAQTAKPLTVPFTNEVWEITLSPNGQSALYTDPLVGGGDIFLWIASQENTKNVTASPSRDQDGVWSPDGTKIAFVSDRDSSTQIYVMDADGTNSYQLTSGSRYSDRPQWTADGNYIVFTSNMGSDFGNVFGLFITDLEENIVRQLTPATLLDDAALTFAIRP